MEFRTLLRRGKWRIHPRPTLWICLRSHLLQTFMVRSPREGERRRTGSGKASMSRKLLMSSSVGSGTTAKSFLGIFADSMRTTDEKRLSEFLPEFSEISATFGSENCKHKNSVISSRFLALQRFELLQAVRIPHERGSCA